MVSIATALEQIKRDPRAAIGASVVEGVCRELGLEWRNTALTPPVTLALLAQQVLAGNLSNPELIRRSGRKVTAAAYCTAKGRLPLESVQELARRVCSAATQSIASDASYRWKGHRTWHIDGSGFSMPDTPELQKQFGQSGNQKKGCGFPVSHLLCQFSAATGLIRDVVAADLRRGDLADTPALHAHLQSGDIVIGDTSFGSYFHIALLSQRGALGVFPNHQKRIVSFRSNRKHGNKDQPSSRWIKRLGKDDQLVEYFKPQTCPKWMSQTQYQAMPASLIVREIRRKVYKSGFRPLVIVVVTTLLDPDRYPADEIVALLKGRWNVETNLRHLKTTMKMDVLHCQSVQGVLKELWTFVLIYNLVRVIMMEAAGRQKVPLERISFADALYWMRHAKPGEQLPDLIVNPHRPNRVEPRAVKRRPKEYDRLTKPRSTLRKALKRRQKGLF